MDNKEIATLKAKFLKMVASVPLPLRTEVIAMVDNQPFSWTAAYAEIKNNTETGKKILKLLKTMGVI